jgi:hypothetical protein
VGGTVACLGPRALGPIPTPPPIDGARYQEDVAWLADDAREGRGIGSQGLAEAARFLAEGFHSAGLEPHEATNDYLQRFEAPVGIEVVRAELSLADSPLGRGEEFEAFLGSGDGSGEAEVVFVGYGISEETLDFDEYAGIDASGRAVLILDHRPDFLAEMNTTHASRLLSRAYKIANARDHGAAAVLFAPSSTDVPGLPGGAGDEPANPTTQSVEIPSLAISRATAEGVVRAAGGATLAERQAEIEQNGRPASALLPGVSMRFAVEVKRRMGQVTNVIAVRRGTDPELASEAIVVGAHYDHLGRGEFGTLAPDRRGQVHNGADDNATGAAGLLALARAFASAPAGRRTLVLAAFTGEEAGLVGSSRYVEDPTIPIDSTVAMINLDMIGRLRDGQLTVFGSETSPDFASLVRAGASGLELKTRLAEGGFGPSDQTSFYAQGVPVLFFFTGAHSQYHTPDDDVELLNLGGASEVLRLVYRVAGALLDAPRRPKVRLAAVPAPSGPGRGYGPDLGTVPDFGGPPVRGVRLAAVRPGSPAETAGLRAGDVIVEFDSASVATLEEFAALLFASRAGQTVEIVIQREGHRIPVTAVLGQRR